MKVVRYLALLFPILLGFSLGCDFAYSSEQIARVSDKNGLPEVLFGGKRIVTAKYVYFGLDSNDKWTWAGQHNNFLVQSDFRYSNIGTNGKLNFELRNSISKKDEHSLSYLFEFDLRQDQPRIVGGGIEFNLDADFNRIYGKPRLLSDNTGWIWGLENGPHIQFKFDRPLKKVFFENRNPNKIRAFFFKDSIEKSKQVYKALFSFSKPMTMEPTPAERFGEIDLEDWFQFDNPYDLPVDLSYLNHLPAGKHGFLQARGEELVFADDTKAKFWGTNISAKALFKTLHVNIPKHARRIAALGFNLVRIHHLDSVWVNPNVFGVKAKSTSRIDDQYMSYLDKWIAELNKQGIYVWFDLHVQRFVTPEDNIFAFDEIDKRTPKYDGRADIKGYAYVNQSIRNSMKDINRQFLSRINRFTNQKYADNPGIAFLLLTNENDLTRHYGNKLLPPKKVPEHTRIYLSEAKAFADRWGLPEKEVWKSWKPGASKLFLNDLEHRFNEELISSLRVYDRHHLISTTNTWGANPLSSLPSLTDGDVIDVHSYGKLGALEGDPSITPNFMHWIAAAHIADKPISITEWNVGKFPVHDRHLSPLLMAGMASHQGWDAIMQFGYTAEPPVKGGKAFNYAMYNDPSFLGTMPAAAIMYRLGHIQEARQKFLLALDKNTLMYQTLSPKTSIAIRTIPEVSKLLIALPEMEELPWMKPTRQPEDALVVRDPAFSAISNDATSATSDTGELVRDWSQGTYTIDTERSKSISGWIGGKTLSLDDVEFAIETRNASIAVQSLDDQPVSTSKNILISLSARSVPEKRGRAPILAEPVIGAIKIHGLPGLRLFRKKLGPDFTEVPMSFADGTYTINLTPELSTYWLFMRDSQPTHFN